MKTPGNTTSSATTASLGNLLSKPLDLPYFGYLHTKKDALLLLERCLRGDLPSLRGPQHTTSAVRDGCVFIWAQDDSAFQDGLLWNPIEYDGEFWINSQAIPGDGLFRKTLSVLAQGRCYHIRCYEDPWKVVDRTLKAPSEDPNLQSITLRDELTSQLTAESQATTDCRYPRAILKVSHVSQSPEWSLQLTIVRLVRLLGTTYSCEMVSSLVCALQIRLITSISCDEIVEPGFPASRSNVHTGRNFPIETCSWASAGGN